MRIREIETASGRAKLRESAGIDTATEYFTDRPINLGNYDWSFANDLWHAFCGYLTDENREKLAARLGVDDLEHSNFHDYEVLPPKGQRFFADWMEDEGHVRQMVYDDPHDAPAWMLLHLVRKLPAGTFVYHFTDQHAAITADGFRIGIPDIDGTAITHRHDAFGNVTKVHSSEPGYNFGYLADGSVDLDLRVGGYAAAGVLIRAEALLLHHDGDGEEQVLFYGPDVTGPVVTTLKKGDFWVASTGERAKSLNALVAALTGRKKPRAKPSAPPTRLRAA